MSEESGIAIGELRVDGSPTRNKYLMQFQSDIAEVSVTGSVRRGIIRYRCSICQLVLRSESTAVEEVFGQMSRTKFSPEIEHFREKSRDVPGWKKAVAQVLTD